MGLVLFSTVHVYLLTSVTCILLMYTQIGDCEDLLEKFVKDLAISDQENQELKEEV